VTGLQGREIVGSRRALPSGRRMNAGQLMIEPTLKRSVLRFGLCPNALQRFSIMLHAAEWPYNSSLLSLVPYLQRLQKVQYQLGGLFFLRKVESFGNAIDRACSNRPWTYDSSCWIY